MGFCGLETISKQNLMTNPLFQLPTEYQYDAGVHSGAFSTSPTFGLSGGVGGVNVGAAAAAAAVFNAASAAAAAQAAAIAAVGSPNQQHMLLPPGEVIRNSGKFPKPTKIPGKTYCKDEVVIRNADSGKGEFPPAIKCPGTHCSMNMNF